MAGGEVLEKQDRRCLCNVRRVHETTVAVESNKYYIHLCVCGGDGGGVGGVVW
jgi:hypothetical protein